MGSMIIHLKKECIINQRQSTEHRNSAFLCPRTVTERFLEMSILAPTEPAFTS